jgi:c-di-GMP-binding flagellar brake protein YcgR
LNKAEADINELMKDQSRKKEIEHPAIGKLSDAQRDRVLRIEISHDTKIQIEKRINRIVVRGASEDVSNATVGWYYENNNY